MKNNVTLIPAKRRNTVVIENEEKVRIRVAAYCRVSTDSDEQAGSYEVQVSHYTEYIQRNRDWILAGVYADDGITGTNTKKRDGFMKLIDDCMDGKIDLVLTKSISRFARNTIDCLKYVRKLKERGIAIIFEKENINTLEASGELLLTIMASLAQQESESLSQNVKLGLQFRYQNGKVQVNHNHFLGYTKDENGNLIIDENEANVVRRIFLEYAEGASLRDIKDGLERDGIQTGGKKYKWHLSTVKGILKNEKYIGDALLQKTITTDFIEKTRKKNDGSYPQYYVKNNHAAIIPRDIFVYVQEEMNRRANMMAGGKKRAYSSKYALSSRCICARCGDIFRRLDYTIDGKRYTIWKCCARIENGPSGCIAETVKETDLHNYVAEAINKVLGSAENIKEKLMENIRTVVSKDYSPEINAVNDILEQKQHELLKLIRERKDYTELAGEIDKIKEQKQRILVKKADDDALKRRIKDLENFIETGDYTLKKYDEALVRKYIDKLIIYDDRLKVIFKAGIDIEIQKH